MAGSEFKNVALHSHAGFLPGFFKTADPFDLLIEVPVAHWSGLEHHVNASAEINHIDGPCLDLAIMLAIAR